MHIKLVQYICPKFHPEKTGASFLLPCLSFLGVMRGQILFCLVLILQPSCSHVLIELFMGCSDSLCVAKLEGRFFSVNTLLNVSCDIGFIVQVYLNSSWSILGKDVCREETSFHSSIFSSDHTITVRISGLKDITNPDRYVVRRWIALWSELLRGGLALAV